MRKKKLKIRLIRFALKIIERRLLKKIKVKAIYDFVKEQIDNLRRIVNIYVDKDPDNTAQLQKLWMEIKDELESDSLTILVDIVKRKVNDTETQETILELIQAYQEDQLEEKELIAKL